MIMILNLFKKSAKAKVIQEGDIYNNTCHGPSYTNWRHSIVCRRCLKHSSREEIMTEICLGCGYTEKTIGVNNFLSVACRKIFLDGEWKEQIRLYNENYINKVEVKTKQGDN